MPMYQMSTVHTERLLIFTEIAVNHRHNSLWVVFLRETDVNLIRLERLMVRMSGLFCNDVGKNERMYMYILFCVV